MKAVTAVPAMMVQQLLHQIPAAQAVILVYAVTPVSLERVVLPKKSIKVLIPAYLPFTGVINFWLWPLFLKKGPLFK
jgi:hypothetical protein